MREDREWLLDEIRALEPLELVEVIVAASDALEYPLRRGDLVEKTEPAA